jgi:hypothetical protein
MMNDVFEKGYPSYEAIHGKQFTLDLHEYSEWQCHLFGSNSDNGISWRPLEGKEPNWFWRKMQYLCFGNKWVKDDNV